MCIRDRGISDHKPQIIIAKILSQSQKHEVKSINKMIRKYNNQSLDLFKNALVTKDWCELIGTCGRQTVMYIGSNSDGDFIASPLIDFYSFVPEDSRRKSFASTLRFKDK